MTDAGYDPPIPDEVRHAAMRWNAPLSEAHASVLLDALELERAESVLDLGCGWGELLLRAAQRTPSLRGVGVDSDSAAIRRGTALVVERGLEERVRLFHAAGESWSEPADRLISVGSTHIWDGTAAALAALRELTIPGGRLLFGDGFLEPNPSSFTRDLFGDVLPLEKVAAAARDADWRVLHLSVSDQFEWDEFESSYRAGTERWLLADPGADDAEGIRAWLDERLSEYLDGYRGELGFCWLVLGRS